MSGGKDSGLRYWRLKSFVVLVTAAAYFVAAFLGQKPKLKILYEKLLIILRRFFGDTPFRFYPLADDIEHGQSLYPGLEFERLLAWKM